MSKAKDQTEYTEKQLEFRSKVKETFAPWEKSYQYKKDDMEDYDPDHATGPRPHNDGQSIYQQLHLERLPDFLERAGRMKHPVAQHPKALAHFLTHVKKWEKWELSDFDPHDDRGYEFGDIPEIRKELFEWYLGFDKDDVDEQEEAMNRRLKRLRPGGTGVVMHGEQGTTKTTAMHWMIANIMEVNQQENVFWFSTLDDTEWQVFAPWATLLLPEGIEVEVTINPHAREYRDVDPFTVPVEEIARNVERYRDPVDAVRIVNERVPGQFYAVYPDPKFRQNQTITGYSYESMWEVDSSEEATPIGHFWFAMTEAVRQSSEYNEWTTLVGDEAHKWLRHGKGNDEHDWWDKIEDWATYWGDARKKRLSVILATHKWTEISSMVRDKVRWGGTMNGEDFPSDAPIGGKNAWDQDLGDMCIWNNLEWNHFGYPDLKRHFSVPGDIEVDYPGFKAEKKRKS